VRPSCLALAIRRPLACNRATVAAHRWLLLKPGGVALSRLDPTGLCAEKELVQAPQVMVDKDCSLPLLISLRKAANHSFVSAIFVLGYTMRRRCYMYNEVRQNSR
jgi:hypothetical protein